MAYGDQFGMAVWKMNIFATNDLIARYQYVWMYSSYANTDDMLLLGIFRSIGFRMNGLHVVKMIAANLALCLPYFIHYFAASVIEDACV